MKRNRPYDSDTDRELFDDSFHTASMSDCTGLIPSAPIDENEIRSYSDIFDIPLPNYRSDLKNMRNDQNKNQNKKDNQNQSKKDNQNQSKKDSYGNRYDSKSFN